MTYRTESPPPSVRDWRVFSTAPEPWARYRVTISKTVFHGDHVAGYARWFLVAWFFAQWHTLRNPHSAVTIHKKVE